MAPPIQFIIKKLWPLFLLSLVWFLDSCAPKRNLSATAFKYHISGSIAGSQDGDTLLLGVIGNSRRINKAIIKNSKFRFKGTVPELSMGLIQYKRSFNITETSAFVIEKTPIVIAAHVLPEDKEYADGKIIKAGKQNEYLQKLEALQTPMAKEMGEASLRIQEAEKANNPAAAKLYREKNLEAAQKNRSIREQFIKEHPDAIAALYSYYNSLDYKIDKPDKALVTLNLFNDQIKRTSLWQKVKNLAGQEALQAK